MAENRQILLIYQSTWTLASAAYGLRDIIRQCTNKVGCLALIWQINRLESICSNDAEYLSLSCGIEKCLNWCCGHLRARREELLLTAEGSLEATTRSISDQEASLASGFDTLDHVLQVSSSSWPSFGH